MAAEGGDDKRKEGDSDEADHEEGAKEEGDGGRGAEEEPEGVPPPPGPAPGRREDASQNPRVRRLPVFLPHLRLGGAVASLGDRPSSDREERARRLPSGFLLVLWTKG